MSDASDAPRGHRGGSFRRPASYGRGQQPSQGEASGGGRASDATDGTRAFTAEELRDASSSAGDTGAPAQGRVDQTLVSPIARDRIRAEINVPDPAYPPRQAPQRAEQDRQRGAVARQGEYQEPPLRHRRQQPQQPPMAPRGYALQPEATAQPSRRRERRHSGHGFARGVLLLVSLLFRLAALGYAALAVVNSFTVGNRVTLMHVTARATELLPQSLAGLYVMDTPFGGAFRGDFAIAAVALFVLDWMFARIRRSLR